MKTTRVFSSAALMIGIGVAQLVACSSDSKHPSGETEATGTMSLPLQTVSASGHVYRLRNAFFTITNKREGTFAGFLSSEDDPSRTTLSQVLATGDYTISLSPGWTLERVVFDGSGGSGNGGSPSGGSPSGGAFPTGGFGAGGKFIGNGGSSTTMGKGGSGPGKGSGGSGAVGGLPTAGGEAGSVAIPGKPAGSGGKSSQIPFEDFGGEFGFAGSPEETGGVFGGFGGFPGFGGKSGGSGGTSSGGGIPVDAHLLSDAVQVFSIFSRSDSFVTYSFQVGGEVLDFNQGRLNVGIDVTEAEVQCDTPADVTRPERVLLENNVDALAKITLRDAFGALAKNGPIPGDGETLFNQVYDSYATADVAQLPDAVHCGDELTNGKPSLNGFPIDCNRFERFHVGAIDQFMATAVVNRIDLAPENGANCGQQRMVFAHRPFNRAFMILEAQIPNPTPELGIKGCAPLAQFWLAQNNISDPIARGNRLMQAFFVGDPDLAAQGFGAFYNPNNLTVGSGQIRTNQFDSSPWALREFKLVADAGKLKTIPFPTAEAPNGALWNENSGFSQGEACRQNFLEAIDGVLTQDIGQMSFIVDQQCRDAESRNDFSQNYASQMSPGFRAQLTQRLAGTGLTAEEAANRAEFAGSCIGCHNESSGANLGLGATAPFSSDFPQVTEFTTTDCGARNAGTLCFQTSTALKELFLPSRLKTLTALVGAPIITDPCENTGGNTGSGGGFNFGGSPSTGAGGGFFTAGSASVGKGGASSRSADAPAQINSQGPAPTVVITLPSASKPLSELVTLDAQLRAQSGARTIGGRSAQVTH